MKLIEYADAEMMAMGLANRLAGDLTLALEQRDRVLLVVPGGTTPGPIFDDLCGVDIDWSRIDVMLSDERWRPEVHVRSNTRLIRERLLVERAARARLLPLYARTETPEEAIEDLIAGIADSLPISVLLLGMGADMHTASLFAKGDNIEAALRRDAPILLPMRVPDEPEPRVTLSARVLNGALRKYVAITGEAKRAALDRARSCTPREAPICAVLEDVDVHWAP